MRKEHSLRYADGHITERVTQMLEITKRERPSVGRKKVNSRSYLMMESTYIYAAESSAIWITLIVLMAKTTKRRKKWKKQIRAHSAQFPLHVRVRPCPIIISSLIFASMEILRS